MVVDGVVRCHADLPDTSDEAVLPEEHGTASHRHPTVRAMREEGQHPLMLPISRINCVLVWKNVDPYSRLIDRMVAGSSPR